MKAPYIKTHIENKRYAKEGTININFDEWEKDTILLEMEIVRENIVEGETFVYWEIFSNGVQLDIGDLTTGQIVELILLKSYAGPPTSPHKFTIRVKDKDKKIITSLEINVFCNLRITKVEWVEASTGKKINRGYLNTNIELLMSGRGYYGVPLTLKIHELETEDVVDGPYFMKLNCLDDIKHFYFNDQSNIIKKITSIIYTFKQKKIYPTLWVNNTLLFDGKKNNVTLELLLDITKNEEENTSLSPIVMNVEEYFTQKYEPCKYEKIIVSYGKQEYVIFDEKKATRKKNFPLRILSGDVKSVEDSLNITIEGVDTQHCQYNEANKNYRIPYKSEKKEEDCFNHKGNVIDSTDIEDSQLIVLDKITDKKIVISRKYPYPEDNKSLDFIKNYFVPENKTTIITINSCRYKKYLNIELIPDIHWAYHLQYESPTKGYYINSSKVELINGLDDELDWLQSMISDAPQASLIDIRKYLIEYIRDIAKDFSFGIQAYYDFDNSGNPKKVLNYTNHQKWISKIVVGTFTALMIIIEIIILYITRGRGGSINKITRVIKKTEKITRKAKRKLKDNDIEFLSPKININRGMGHSIDENGDLVFTIEENVTAAPLIGVQYENKHSIGTYVLDKLKISKLFDNLRKHAGDIVLWNGAWSVKKEDIQNKLDEIEDGMEDSIDSFMKDYLVSPEFIFTINGTYDAYYQIKATFKNKKPVLTLKNYNENHKQVNPSVVTFGRSKGIDAEARFKVSTKIRVVTFWLAQYIPTYLEDKKKEQEQGKIVEANAEAKVCGGIVYERVYRAKTDGSVTVQDNTLFTGLIAEFKIEIEIEEQTKNDRKFKTPDEKTKTEENTKRLVLVEPCDIIGKEKSVFSKEYILECIMKHNGNII